MKIYKVPQDLTYLQANRKQVYIQLCYNEAEIVRDGDLTQEQEGILLNYKLFTVSSQCRYCKKEIDKKDFAITIPYYSQTAYLGLLHNFSPCHKQCKEQGEKQEAYECQNIDKACNDCKFFERYKDNSKKGLCTKFNREEIAGQRICIPEHDGCFTNRKD